MTPLRQLIESVEKLTGYVPVIPPRTRQQATMTHYRNSHYVHRDEVLAILRAYQAQQEGEG